MLYITVKLYGKTGLPGEFREYESKALALFKRHGGEVVIAYVPVKEPVNADFPDEIQILKIKNKAAFEKFLHDPERKLMAQERDSVIRKTEVFISGELIPY